MVGCSEAPSPALLLIPSLDAIAAAGSELDADAIVLKANAGACATADALELSVGV